LRISLPPTIPHFFTLPFTRVCVTRYTRLDALVGCSVAGSTPATYVVHRTAFCHTFWFTFGLLRLLHAFAHTHVLRFYRSVATGRLLHGLPPQRARTRWFGYRFIRFGYTHTCRTHCGSTVYLYTRSCAHALHAAHRSRLVRTVPAALLHTHGYGYTVTRTHHHTHLPVTPHTYPHGCTHHCSLFTLVLVPHGSRAVARLRSHAFGSLRVYVIHFGYTRLRIPHTTRSTTTFTLGCSRFCLPRSHGLRLRFTPHTRYLVYYVLRCYYYTHVCVRYRLHFTPHHGLPHLDVDRSTRSTALPFGFGRTPHTPFARCLHTVTVTVRWLRCGCGSAFTLPHTHVDVYHTIYVVTFAVYVCAHLHVAVYTRWLGTPGLRSPYTRLRSLPTVHRLFPLRFTTHHTHTFAGSTHGLRLLGYLVSRLRLPLPGWLRCRFGAVRFTFTRYTVYPRYVAYGRLPHVTGSRSRSLPVPGWFAFIRYHVLRSRLRYALPFTRYVCYTRCGYCYGCVYARFATRWILHAHTYVYVHTFGAVYVAYGSLHLRLHTHYLRTPAHTPFLHTHTYVGCYFTYTRSGLPRPATVLGYTVPYLTAHRARSAYVCLRFTFGYTRLPFGWVLAVRFTHFRYHTCLVPCHTVPRILRLPHGLFGSRYIPGSPAALRFAPPHVLVYRFTPHFVVAGCVTFYGYGSLRYHGSPHGYCVCHATFVATHVTAARSALRLHVYTTRSPYAFGLFTWFATFVTFTHYTFPHRYAHLPGCVTAGYVYAVTVPVVCYVWFTHTLPRCRLVTFAGYTVHTLGLPHAHGWRSYGCCHVCVGSGLRLRLRCGYVLPLPHTTFYSALPHTFAGFTAHPTFGSRLRWIAFTYRTLPRAHGSTVPGCTGLRIYTFTVTGLPLHHILLYTRLIYSSRSVTGWLVTVATVLPRLLPVGCGLHTRTVGLPHSCLPFHGYPLPYLYIWLYARFTAHVTLRVSRYLPTTVPLHAPVHAYPARFAHAHCAVCHGVRAPSHHIPPHLPHARVYHGYRWVPHATHRAPRDHVYARFRFTTTCTPRVSATPCMFYGLRITHRTRTRTVWFVTTRVHTAFPIACTPPFAYTVTLHHALHVPFHVLAVVCWLRSARFFTGYWLVTGYAMGLVYCHCGSLHAHTAVPHGLYAHGCGCTCHTVTTPRFSIHTHTGYHYLGCYLVGCAYLYHGIAHRAHTHTHRYGFLHVCGSFTHTWLVTFIPVYAVGYVATSHGFHCTRLVRYRSHTGLLRSHIPVATAVYVAFNGSALLPLHTFLPVTLHLLRTRTTPARATFGSGSHAVGLHTHTVTRVAACTPPPLPGSGSHAVACRTRLRSHGSRVRFGSFGLRRILHLHTRTAVLRAGSPVGFGLPVTLRCSTAVTTYLGSRWFTTVPVTAVLPDTGLFWITTPRHIPHLPLRSHLRVLPTTPHHGSTCYPHTGCSSYGLRLRYTPPHGSFVPVGWVGLPVTQFTFPDTRFTIPTTHGYTPLPRFLPVTRTPRLICYTARLPPFVHTTVHTGLFLQFSCYHVYRTYTLGLGYATRVYVGLPVLGYPRFLTFCRCGCCYYRWTHFPRTAPRFVTLPGFVLVIFTLYTGLHTWLHTTTYHTHFAFTFTVTFYRTRARPFHVRLLYDLILVYPRSFVVVALDYVWYLFTFTLHSCSAVCLLHTPGFCTLRITVAFVHTRMQFYLRGWISHTGYVWLIYHGWFTFHDLPHAYGCYTVLVMPHVRLHAFWITHVLHIAAVAAVGYLYCVCYVRTYLRSPLPRVPLRTLVRDYVLWFVPIYVRLPPTFVTFYIVLHCLHVPPTFRVYRAHAVHTHLRGLPTQLRLGSSWLPVGLQHLRVLILRVCGYVACGYRARLPARISPACLCRAAVTCRVYVLTPALAICSTLHRYCLPPHTAVTVCHGYRILFAVVRSPAPWFCRSFLVRSLGWIWLVILVLLVTYRFVCHYRLPSVTLRSTLPVLHTRTFWFTHRAVTGFTHTTGSYRSFLYLVTVPHVGLHTCYVGYVRLFTDLDLHTVTVAGCTDVYAAHPHHTRTHTTLLPRLGSRGYTFTVPTRLPLLVAYTHAVHHGSHYLRTALVVLRFVTVYTTHWFAFYYHAHTHTALHTPPCIITFLRSDFPTFYWVLTHGYYIYTFYTPGSHALPLPLVAFHYHTRSRTPGSCGLRYTIRLVGCLPPVLRFFAFGSFSLYRWVLPHAVTTHVLPRIRSATTLPPLPVTHTRTRLHTLPTVTRSPLLPHTGLFCGLRFTVTHTAHAACHTFTVTHILRFSLFRIPRSDISLSL